MASLLTFSDFMASGGLYGASEEKIDMSEILAAVLFENKTLLGMIKWGPPAENIVFKHLEDNLNLPTILGQYVTSGNIFTPATVMPNGESTTQADVYRMLRHSASGGALGLLLHVDVGDGQGFVLRRTVDTGVPLGGDGNWEIIGGTEAAVSSNTKFYISLPKADEADASVDTAKGRTVRQGLVRVFERAIEVAETRQHIEMYAVSDEVKLQTKYRTLELANELASTCIREWVKISSNVPDISNLAGTRTFAGILQQCYDPNLDNAAGTFDTLLHTDAAGASMITKAFLNATVEDLLDGGGLDASGYDGVIVCNPVQARQISTFDESYRRSSLEYRKAGYFVDTFMSDLGYEYPIVVERYWPTTVVGILDLSRIEMRALQGDDWHLEKMAKTGRTDKWQLSGQFGVSVKNIDFCQALIYKLSTS